MKPWTFAQNPFLNATIESFSRAMTISTFHDSALDNAKSDPFFLGLYNAFHPSHVNYETAYDSWIAYGGTQQSHTLNFHQMLELLMNTKIEQWDVQIRNVYGVKTPEYKKLFPKRRRPFQQGEYSKRVHMVKALSDAIGPDTKLVTVKTDIDTFYAQLNNAFSSKTGVFSGGKDMSDDLEKLRVTMCKAMFANLGALIQKFFDTPEKIENYFDMQSIRRSQQVLFKGHVKPGEVYSIMKHTFGETDEISLSNEEPVPLKFYLAAAKDSLPDSSGFTLNAGEDTVLASALGKLTNSFLNVYNPDTVQTGVFEVDLG